MSFFFYVLKIVSIESAGYLTTFFDICDEIILKNRITDTSSKQYF